MNIADVSFDIQTTPRAQFGAGAVDKLGKRVRATGARRALIVTDEGVVRAGIVARVQAALEAGGIEVTTFAEVEPNPRAATAERGGAALAALSDAVVVAVGGGSSMDAAKAVALLGPNGGSARDFPFGCKPGRPGRPVVCVPTTAGTGSETNMFGVVTDEQAGRKVLVAHASVLPVLVVLDPSVTVGLPPRVTAQTGMDVLVHAIEAASSARTQPLSEAIAQRAIAMVGQFLPRAVDDGNDLEARAQMLLAAHLAGIAFASSGLGICHAMGHPLSARLDAAHGQTLATLLPHIMRFNLEVSAPRYAGVARALGVARGDERADAERSIEAVTALSTRVGTNLPARELGMTAELIPTLVDDALADLLMLTTPRFPSAEQVETLYRAAL